MSIQNTISSEKSFKNKINVLSNKMKADKVLLKQMCTTRNYKKGSSNWREMIPYGNSDLQEEKKDTKK